MPRTSFNIPPDRVAATTLVERGCEYHWTLVGAPLISAANPDISADVNWASEFQSRLTRRGIARMVGCKNLNTRPNLGLVANADLDNIQDAWNGMALLA